MKYHNDYSVVSVGCSPDWEQDVEDNPPEITAMGDVVRRGLTCDVANAIATTKNLELIDNKIFGIWHLVFAPGAIVQPD